MSSEIEVELGITRSSDGFYYIRIGCESSRINFCDIKLTSEQFAEAVTGLHSGGIQATVRGLDRVGKQRVREERTIICPLQTWKKEELQTWLTENCQEEGWTIDLYLGSQKSYKSVTNGTKINYSVYKYVDVK